jgi:hypothetical protein
LFFRNAIFSYSHLSKAVSNAANRAAFIRSLADKSTGLFAHRSGEKSTDLRSTVHALEALKALNELDNYLAGGARALISDYLKSAERETASQIYFQFAKEIRLSPVGNDNEHKKRSGRRR